MFHFILLFSRHGKVRLKRWFTPFSAREKHQFSVEAVSTILSRKTAMCNVIEWKHAHKLIYKRYASLYFMACIDEHDNELIALEMLHRYVEVLDEYYGSVCELDIIFNFDQAYHLLDELFLDGEMSEPSRRVVVQSMKMADEAVKNDLIANNLRESSVV